MVGYLRRGQPGKSFIFLGFWGIVTALLIYEYIAWRVVPGFVITCSVLTIIGHTFIGGFLDIYHKSISFDRYLHLFGSFSFSLLLFSFCDINAIAWGFYRFLFVSMLGNTLGIIFEIGEYFRDTFTQMPKCQHGLADTDLDIIFNFIGAVIAGFVSLYIF